jgi:hypothetical protein
MIDDAFGDYEDVFEEEWPEGYPRDKVVDKAKEALIDFFVKNNEDVFYMQQLEVNSAVVELVKNRLAKAKSV